MDAAVRVVVDAPGALDSRCQIGTNHISLVLHLMGAVGLGNPYAACLRSLTFEPVFTDVIRTTATDRPIWSEFNVKLDWISFRAGTVLCELHIVAGPLSTWVHQGSLEGLSMVGALAQRLQLNLLCTS